MNVTITGPLTTVQTGISTVIKNLAFVYLDKFLTNASMPTACIDTKGTEYSFTDSGPAAGSSDYTTLMIYHGTIFNGGMNNQRITESKKRLNITRSYLHRKLPKAFPAPQYDTGKYSPRLK